VRYRVEFAPAAVRQIGKLERNSQRRIVARIEALSSTPRPAGTRKLVGKSDLYRVRIGEHRVIYQIRDDQLLVLIVKVGHRRDVYS